MRLLLDTHILLWWATADRRLPKTLAKVLTSAENDIAVSAASIWEIVIKRMLGRIEVDVDELLSSSIADGLTELPIRFAHARKLELLPRHHDDPFDRILIAQSISEGRRLVTTDRAILDYSGLAGFDPLAG
ncbi:MAG TPA: type II toxin-antitoxin system VapC family toxin [Thermoanaerobaculia bacterium]|jgi:PIN domain nuclease of toxin-antitoxin system|nr:type II toxin-antitoxin system VapC family toxin [Thermoanaerobaculia bacterium]